MSGTLAILDRLIGFDTVSARSNLALIDYVEGFLQDRGARVTRIEDETEPKAGIYAEIGPSGAGVLLSGHSDVVPVEGQVWTRPAFNLTQEGDKLFGRGTTDMKGFVAAMLNAADAASRMKLSEPLKLVLSYDEEVGCTGIARMKDRLAPLLGRPRLAIVGEPTEMQVAIGHKGKQGFRAVVTGQAGHSSLAPNFVNALHVATDFIAGLRTIQADLASNGARDPAFEVPYSTLHVGTLQGGTALNIVPDRAEITFEMRTLSATEAEALSARIETVARDVCAMHGPAATIRIERAAGYPGLDTRSDAAAVALVKSLAGTDSTKVSFGTEAGTFDALGIPTVVCGPGSMAGQGHKADEYIETTQLAACDAMLARLRDALM